ncbi:SGNH/GDSL hydrolase family protein [Lactiplantibacillus plantarum]|nr:SGNH/GDSL hydrolase family protein [Lactiplantibacillus plantarum]
MAISNGHVSFKRPAWLGDSITANNGLTTVHYHDILAADWDVERSDNLGISGSTIGSRYDAMRRAIKLFLKMLILLLSLGASMTMVGISR